jgi:enolase
VNKAVASVNGPAREALLGLDALDQRAADAALISADGSRQKANFGGNAIVATSGAVAWAAATHQRIPLWQHLSACTGAETLHPQISAPMIQIFGGGAHAGERVDIQDFLVMCVGATSFTQAMEWTAEVYLAATALMRTRGSLAGVCDEGGLWPDFGANEEALEILTLAIEQAGLRTGADVAIALDVAASEFYADGAYRLKLDDRNLKTDAFIDLLSGWCDRYPILSLEDPLSEDDDDGFVEITGRLGAAVQIIGDDYLTTNVDSIRQAGPRGACNAVLLKSNQCGTLSEVIEASQAARGFAWNCIMSGRSGETEDVTLSHLAVGLGADFIKVGSMTRSERMCKWNEMIRIEEQAGNLAYWQFRLPTG